ncbi:MAG: outer membrane lipoprotein-sorting protein [Spirochaetales bacterium]|nr:outer membrane lipoprotein-sorting protein [Spirochaetales bacterium]
MKNLVTVLFLFCAVFISAQNADWILAQADTRRAVADSFRFQITISDYENGVPVNQALMSGRAKGMNKTMVEYQEPVDMRGKKLLMVGDDLFIFVPRTRRPVRLTASQRLMGQASNGDVMNVRFQADYSPVLTREEIVETEDGAAQCMVLELTAKRKGTAYKRIILWVDSEGFFPVKADCYALSGKLLKTIVYSQRKNMGTRTIVTKATLYDKVKTGCHTVIEFVDMAEEEISDNIFNKEYLLRM